MSTNVILSQSGSIARIRFDAPNGIHILSADTRRLLSETLAKLDCDPACRVIIFEAHGRTFLAGADLAELRDLNQDSAQVFAEVGQGLMNEIAALRAVTICAIQAACVGGGCELALACDFRLAATGARIGLPETSLGVIPGWGGTVRSTMLLGPSVARRMVLTAELYSAEAAEKLGLVDQVFPDDGLAEGVDHLVAQLLSRGPEALKRAKKQISQQTRSGVKKALAREARQFAACYGSSEPAEGITAFREKRAPTWGGTIPAEPAAPQPAEAVEAKPQKPKRQPKTKPKLE